MFQDHKASQPGSQRDFRWCALNHCASASPLRWAKGFGIKSFFFFFNSKLGSATQELWKLGELTYTFVSPLLTGRALGLTSWDFLARFMWGDTHLSQYLTSNKTLTKDSLYYIIVIMTVGDLKIKRYFTESKELLI